MSKFFSHQTTLPILGKHQVWCCAHGCGDCTPTQIDAAYSHDDDLHDDTLIQPIWASSCCGDALMLWDSSAQVFVAAPDV